MRAKDLELVVHHNLDNALDNGYDATQWAIGDTVADLNRCAADCACLSHDDMAPHIGTWIRKRNRLKEVEVLEKPLREHAATQPHLLFQEVVSRLRNAAGHPLRQTAQAYNAKMWEIQNGR